MRSRLRGARPRSSTSRNTPPPHCWRASATGAATTKRRRYALEALKGPFAFIREEQIKNLFLGYTARTECIWGLHAPDMYLDVRSRLYPTRLTDELDLVRDNYQTILPRVVVHVDQQRLPLPELFHPHQMGALGGVAHQVLRQILRRGADRPFGAHPGAESGASARAVLHSGRIGLRPRSGRCARISEYRGDGTRPAPDRGGRHRHAQRASAKSFSTRS